jgi:molecular chaperone DnaJ
VREDDRFLRDGTDLVTVVDILAPRAALGTTVTVATLEGEREVEVPAGTQPGEIIQLRGEGMPPLHRGRRGDLRVVVNVVVPRKLNREQRDLLERLSESFGDDAGRDDDSMIGKLRRLLAG